MEKVKSILKKTKPLRMALMMTVVCVAVGNLPLNWHTVGEKTALLAVSLSKPQKAVAIWQSKPPAQEKIAVSKAEEKKTEEAPQEENNANTEQSVAVAVVTQEKVIPPEDGTGGKIREQTVDTGNRITSAVAIQNRSGTAVDIADALGTALTQTFEPIEAPQVLIVHTHTTEQYMTYDRGYYNSSDRVRNAGDTNRTVIQVGEAIVQALKEKGIASVHDTTVHDSPKYSGAYTRSAETVEKNRAYYPNLKVVLDIHRDAIMEGETTLAKPTVTVDGRKAAQMMMIVGVVSTPAMPSPYWKQNLALATQWQKKLTDNYGDIMRPLNTVASRYNQHICPGYLLVEVGSEGNTVEEAEYSGYLLGKTLAELLCP